MGCGTVTPKRCQWEGQCPMMGVSGRNSVPSLVSVGGTMSHDGCQWGNSVPSLVSVGGTMSHHGCQWEE
ncbi:unnamed protein product [Staurois parvus]|uniref:Uncharacterized protein n=1 Tax=Staurois parvus TaxID=386267 RepID=A0ABN9DAU9_9NEOB|nr:unnamed protein product [Staurois parvus]